MNFDDPFSGYSFLLRTIIYVLVPAFGVLQFFRLRRALHIFQLEGYKRQRFLEWCRANPERAWFLKRATAKKPLVMTGRAWRLLTMATFMSVAVVLVASGVAHLSGGWPFDVGAWAAMTVAVFLLTTRLLVLTDVVLHPIQSAINRRFLRAATAKLGSIAPRVVGVTGSFGKTSTKHAIGTLIGEPDEVLITPGSYNTPLGVCRTINEQLGSKHRYFVVEMGAYRQGDIRELCEFVQPGIGVLTAVGPAHLERFGSLDAIRKAKYEIVESLGPEGIAVMNVDDPEVRALADATTAVRVVRYGSAPEGRPDVSARDVTTTERGTSFTLVTPHGERSGLEVALLGVHAIGHVLAGVAVAMELGAGLDRIVSRFVRLRAPEHRLALIEGTGGVTVIDDAYNSNPAGADAALDVLESMPAKQKVVVSPGMVELGPLQAEANETFGRRVGQVADVFVAVGRLNRTALLAGAAGGRARVIEVDTLDEATAHLGTLLGRGDVVLFENDLPDQLEG